ncbi:MAG: glycosyltransferase family 4 protein [Xanthobacteraceae bacterium]
MKPVVFAVPGDLATPTGGFAYDRRIIAELRELGLAVEVTNLGEGFPSPSPETRTAALAALDRVPAGSPVIIDGLAFGILPELAETCCRTRAVIALVHHPLALETGLPEAAVARLRASEITALAGARHIVTTSESTARILVSDYAVPRDRVTVAPPGTDRIAAHVQRDSGGPVKLLAVGSLVPRKGFDVLIAALAAVADLDWYLTIAGADDRDPVTARQIAAQIAACGLVPRVTLAGAVAPDRLARLYAEADLFVLASRFEGYGMAFAEAISYGLPMIGTTAGAIPEAVPAGAGVLVPPDDVGALAAALRRLIGDRDERARLARAARNAAGRLPTWQDSARLIAAAIEAVT